MAGYRLPIEEIPYLAQPQMREFRTLPQPFGEADVGAAKYYGTATTEYAPRPVRYARAVVSRKGQIPEVIGLARQILANQGYASKPYPKGAWKQAISEAGRSISGRRLAQLPAYEREREENRIARRNDPRTKALRAELRAVKARHTDELLVRGQTPPWRYAKFVSKAKTEAGAQRAAVRRPRKYA
jgi:hypothetical protein